MTPTTLDSAAESTKTCVRDAAVDAVRQASHIAHEARMLKSMAADAIEDGLHAARRTVTRRLRDVEDLRDSAAVRIRRTPFTAVTLAVTTGALIGAAVVWGFTRREA